MNGSLETVLSPSAPASAIGLEWFVDASGCDPVRLGDLPTLRRLLEAIIAELGLRPLAQGLWHRFPAPGGVTGMYLLAESHLTCHTWPEYGVAAFNLFCCRPRPADDWETRLKEVLGATHVGVRCVARGEARR